MTREQAKQNLIALGIAEPTEEQVNHYLNAVNGEVQKEKDNSKKYKADADKLAGVQKELDDLKSANMSDAEKAAQALKDAQDKIAELEKKDAVRQQRAVAMEKFKVDSNQAAQIIKDDGTFDSDVLGKIIAEKETAAANAKEKEIAERSGNPGGGGAGGKEKEKTADVENAEKIFFGSADAKKAQTVRNYYM